MRRRLSNIPSVVMAGLGLAMCFAVPGCGDQPILNAVGSYSDIAILVDRTLLPVATTLKQVLEVNVEYSLRPEKMFAVDIFDLRDKKDASVYKNVIVVGLMGGRDRSSKEIQRHLAGDTMKGLVPKQLYIATRDDTYARNQNVLFLAGLDRNLMQSAIRREAAVLRGQIETRNRERVLSYLLAQGHNDDLELQIEDQAGFHLDVPESYEVTRFFLGENQGSVEVACNRPTRTVAVMWQPLPSSDVLERPQELLEIRREWGKAYLEEGLQDAGGYSWTRTAFAGSEVPMLAGFWETDDYGGPFRTIFYVDQRAQRLYGINTLCYAPNMPKHVYMREALAVAESFRP